MHLNMGSRQIIKLLIGNVLEWYDFSIYGIFALQISKSFFPNYSSMSALLLTFLTFAFGFISRPIGAILFGYIGDTRGRYYAVNISIFCMAATTFLIGVLPDYNHIGIIAPIFLVILRFIQGLSAGGQFSGVITIISENNKNIPLYIGLSNSIALIGILIATIVGLIITEFFSHFIGFTSLEWRIPFLLSILMLIIYAFMKVEIETIKTINNNRTYPIFYIFTHQPIELFFTIILSILYSSLYYIFFVYLITYLQKNLNIGISNSFLLMNIMILFAIAIFTLFGYITRNYTSRLKKSQYLVLGSFLPIIVLFINSNTWINITAFAILLTNFCIIVILCNAIFAEVFDKQYKMTACSFSYNTGIAISGFSPLVADFFSGHFKSGLQWLLCLIFIGLLIATKCTLSTNGYKKHAQH